MKLLLTAAQLRELEPLLARAAAPGSPDLLVGQIMREPWTDGAKVYLDVKLIARATAEKMRAVFVKAHRRSATS